MHLLILGTATVLIAALAAALWKRTGDWSPVVVSAALYYWSLFGAWGLIQDKLGGYSGKKYHYLESRLFPIDLDVHYSWSLALYAAFVVVAQATALALAHRRPTAAAARLRISHGRLLAWSAAACVATLALMKGHLETAWELRQSAYFYTRFAGDELFTLRQVLNRAALIPPAIGCGILLAGRESRFFSSPARGWHAAGYAALFLVMGGFTFLLGNKNEVFVAMLCGGLTYYHAAWRPRRLALAAAGIAGLWFLYAIDVFRGVPMTELRDSLLTRAGEANQLGTFVGSSNEAYGAHFSLYGVLAQEVETRFGYGVFSLVCSLVPRVVWPSRPADIYEYYAASIGASGGQGFSIHHATGWYLSFGLAGIPIGGFVLGLAWSAALNLWRRCRWRSGASLRLAGILAPWLLAACVPPLLRAGIEGYKGLLVDAALIPLAAMTLSCTVAPAGKAVRR